MSKKKQCSFTKKLHLTRGKKDRRSLLDFRRPRFTFEALESRQLLSAGLMISEFMASNSHNLADADGDHPDWIEIYNPTSAPVNLNGWSLTDDAAMLGKWHFRSMPGAF